MAGDSPRASILRGTFSIITEFQFEFERNEIVVVSLHTGIVYLTVPVKEFRVHCGSQYPSNERNSG